MLLHHVNDSLTTLHEAIETGHIGPDPTPADAADLTADLTKTFRDRACQLLDAWTAGGDQDQVISIAEGRLMARVVAGTGAIEIAVHGWDIAQACGHPQPIPPALANDILKVISLAADVTRDDQFAAPVTVSPLASPGDRLVAFLGRRPVG
jgi:uncharacterized protein (TIGR03086 family)